jgi:hypothetical protein
MPGLPARQATRNEHVVDNRADDAAGDGTHDRHPPPAVGGAEHAGTPPGHRGEQARPEVARRVDGVAGVEAEGDADGHHQRAHQRRGEPGGGTRVLLIANGQHAQHQQRGAHHLVDQTAAEREERLRIGGEDARRAERALHLPDAAVEGREGLPVREEDERGADERAGRLRQGKDRHLAPRKTAAHSQGDRDRRVEVRAGHAGRDVDPQHHTEAPPEVDGQVRPVGVLAEHRLRDDAGAEHDEDQGPDELRRCLFEHGGLWISVTAAR